MAQQVARKFFVGGNFKMNCIRSSLLQIVDHLNKAALDANTEVVIAPPAQLLMLAREHLRREISVAAQNVYDKPMGAYTGEISVEQILDAGATWVICGHSERRMIMGESNDVVASKVKAAVNGGLKVILCCGETEDQRTNGETENVVTQQLEAVQQSVTAEQWSSIVVAYEPVWAIGTGRVATASQAQQVHAHIRKWLQLTLKTHLAQRTRIIYGGSVTPANCSELATQPDVDGFLVGGASLKPDFIKIVNVRELAASAAT